MLVAAHSPIKYCYCIVLPQLQCLHHQLWQSLQVIRNNCPFLSVDDKLCPSRQLTRKQLTRNQLTRKQLALPCSTIHTGMWPSPEAEMQDFGRFNSKTFVPTVMKTSSISLWVINWPVPLHVPVSHFVRYICTQCPFRRLNICNYHQDMHPSQLQS